ncbi:MAG: hypothetical protein PUE60_00160 [Eubacteriales bacterium]|nr:hypothetical protein [Eubacteriales bacterium]
MADGSIKIKVNFDDSSAEQSVENLIRMTDEAVKNLNKQTKKFKFDYDTKGAQEKVKQLNREIADSEKGIQQAKAEFQKSIDSQISALDKQIVKSKEALQKLQSSKDYQNYDSEIEQAGKIYDDLIRNSKTQQEINSHTQTYENTLNRIDEKYSSIIQKAEAYRSTISSLNSQKTTIQSAPQQTQAYSTYQSKKTGYETKIESAKSSINDVASESSAAGTKAQKLTSAFNFMKKGANGAKNAVKGIAGGIGTALSGAKKLVTAVGSKLMSGLKKGVSHFKNMGKGADSVVKKVKKMALAMLGMRGVMGGIKQIVSSAMSNNEELQNSLTAAKGVLGEAITPIISVLVKGLQTAVTLADRLYQIFTGTSLIAQYNAKQAQKEAKAKEQTAKSEAKQLASFDVANKLEDNSSSNSSNDDNSDASQPFKAANLSSGVTKMFDDLKTAFLNGDYEGMGETLAKGLNSIIAKANNLDWKKIQDKVKGFAEGLGSAINGFTKDFDWNGAGKLLGNGLNTITTAISSFVDKVNWDSIGAGISESLNGFVDEIDPVKLGKTLTAKLKILTETLYGFFNGDGKGKKGFDFANLGKKLGQTINAGLSNIDTKKIGSNITSAISGLGETVYNAVKTINWNNGKDSVVSKIEDFVKGLDWKTAFTNIFKALGATLGGLSSVIIQLLKDAFTNFYNKYFKSELDKAGGNVIEGIFNGIVNFLKDVGKWISDNILTPFIDGFRETFNIHSPSRNPAILELGRNIIAGVFNGVIDWLANIGSWLQTNVFDKIVGAWNGMKELTVEIGANLKETFNNAKEKWDSVVDKATTLTADVKDHFSSLKEKWDNWADNTKTATAQTVQSAFDGLLKNWNGWSDKAKTATANIKDNFSKLKTKWDKFKDKSATLTATAELKDKATEAIQNIINKISELFDKFQSVGMNIADFFNSAKDTLTSGFSSLTSAADSSSSSSSSTGGIGSWFKNLFSRKRAVGGIVNNPGRGVPLTAGEAGREAILPLDNNTEWMDMLAQKLANIGGNGGGVVQVVIDGKVVAQAVNKANRQKATMTG